MAEISNGTLALLVLVALAVVITTTTLQLNGGLTGFATSDSGTVTLTINDSLAIEVDSGNNTIAFGTCTPNATAAYTVDSNNTAVDAGGQCSGDLVTPQRIQVNNVGNVDAGINVTGECSTQDFIPTASGAGSSFAIATYDLGGCTGTIIGAYTNLTTANQVACSNLTQATGTFWMPAQVRNPTDTLTNQSCGGDTTNTITFTGYTI